MFASLGQWILGVVSRPPQGHNEGYNEVEEEIPPPPFLPPERISRFEIIQNGNQDSNETANSDVFQRLPSDIRRLIMIEAFGNRVIHVDLRLVKLGGTFAADEPHHGCDPEHGFRKAGKTTPFSSSNAPPQWRWYGCVCHREPEWRMRHHTIMNKSLSPPWFDTCLNARRDDEEAESRLVCEEWSGQKPLKCRIGAMGWLRSCRQA